MQRRAPLKRRGRTRSSLERALSGVWAEEVRSKSCLACGYDPMKVIREFGASEEIRIIRGHHALRQQVIKREANRLGLFGENLIRALWDRRNRMPVCDPCHEGHHGSPPVRIPLSCVPESAYDFADELGLIGELERDYAQ